ncbi:serine/threonine protein kinase [Thalassolituus oleivorans]|uniref:serine/threonine protein kinase n=1 Tax=Thalassolituus oleivorans TaxID=187493 RepID=UPI00042DCFBC|nr:serine/threonine protein kinase [Thalassolituus oleivorans]AHK16652.1 serine/threonine protein kinase [Thalassolituus oleivorans R6-15]MCA6126606.1 serine/threonine protein kinase [Thalassolituus oleivorans 4BN06-13]
MSSHPYATLTPERVMDAVDSLGYLCDARILALNSYENRVYQVGIEDQLPLIAKFYRPGRWSRAAIAEEHQFLFELEREELPVVAPILHGGESVFEFDGFYFALFPRRGGHAPELSNEDDLELLGRWLGRLHNIGSRKPFAERATIRGGDDIRLAAEQVLKCGLMPDDFRPAYESLIRDLLAHIDQQYPTDKLKTLRLHGDLHTGNLLLREDVLHMVDFDDCIQGPAMQDIWMLLSGDRAEQRQQLMVISEGYEMFRPFPNHELRLIESLRTVRIVRYAAWLSQRWDDPAFPIAFPWFEGHRFWSEHLLSLREQLAALQEEPLSISVY